jgi:hypothetical protein
MYLLHVINSDWQTRLLNVFGQISMYWEEENRSVTVDLVIVRKGGGMENQIFIPQTCR